MSHHSRSTFIGLIIACLLVGGFAGGAAGLLVGSGVRILPVETVRTVTPADATVEAVKRVSPAVVSIIIKREDVFFGGLDEVGGGSGFLVSEDGMIVTNRHVVGDKNAEYTAVLADGRKLPLKVLAIDPLIDLAVAKVEATGLPTATLGDSDKIELGETVIAIGNALGELRGTVTKGIISGINRRVVAGDGFGQSEVIEEAIQTDAAINPGNSGGPLINIRGEVVGVNVAVSRGAQGVGFAVPANTARRIVESVQKTGRIVRAWLGVRYTVTADGARVRDVVKGSPAEKAGLKKDDIITKIDGKPVNEEHSLGSFITPKSPGDVVTLTVKRADAETTVRVTLEELKELPQ